MNVLLQKEYRKKALPLHKEVFDMGLKILIVDDSRMMQRMIADTLRKYNISDSIVYKWIKTSRLSPFHPKMKHCRLELLVTHK